MEDHVIICRCEEITYGEIKQAIRDGATTLDGIKRVTRAGKGLCQGRTCRTLITQILNQELGRAPEGIKPRLLPDEKGKRCDRTGTR